MTALQSIQQLLKQNASPEGLAASRKFVPGVSKVYGVRMPVLNQLAKQFSAEGFKLVQALWKAGSLEEKILAAKILERIAKQDPKLAIDLVTSFSTGIDNWAVCDALGMQSLKGLVKTHAEEIFSLARKLNTAENLWQRRLSLVLVEWYTRDKKKHTEINALVKLLEKDEEYYVRKAVEWIKRNMQKGK
ncbi:MAG: DNA alkylation repair protein [Chitinophagaceae bacterium]